MKKIKYLILIILLIAFIFSAGCPLDILAIPLHKRKSEENVPAEYDLTKLRKTDEKILVLVEQPGWLNIKFNARRELAKSINKELQLKLEVDEEQVYDYEKVSGLIENHQRPYLNPGKVGKDAGAEYVLFVTIDSCRLDRTADISNINAGMSYRAKLIEVSKNEKVWPISAKYKTVKIAFEFESGGLQVAISRLTASAAKGVVRYFYDCPYYKFKFSDEKTVDEWDNWNTNF